MLTPGFEEKLLKAIRDLEATTESRLDALVQKVESRLEMMEQNLESRLDALVRMVESRMDDIEEIYVTAWESRRTLSPSDSEATRSQIEITGGNLEDWSSNGESECSDIEECDGEGGVVVPNDTNKRSPPKRDRHPKWQRLAEFGSGGKVL